MIHLCFNDDKSLCGAAILGGDVLTCETPPYNRAPKTLCSPCHLLYKMEREKERREDIAKGEEAYRNLPYKEKRRRKLEGLAHLWEDQMGVIGYLMIMMVTCGLALPVVSATKAYARFMLRREFGEPEKVAQWGCPECKIPLWTVEELGKHLCGKALEASLPGFGPCSDCEFKSLTAEEFEQHYKKCSPKTIKLGKQ